MTTNAFLQIFPDLCAKRLITANLERKTFRIQESSNFLYNEYQQIPRKISNFSVFQIVSSTFFLHIFRIPLSETWRKLIWDQIQLYSTVQYSTMKPIINLLLSFGHIHWNNSFDNAGNVWVQFFIVICSMFWLTSERLKSFNWNNSKCLGSTKNY